jgi:hypothetical protein
MALGSIEDWRFTTSDTTPMRVNKPGGGARCNPVAAVRQ